MGNSKRWFAPQMAKGDEIMGNEEIKSRPEFEKALCKVFKTEDLKKIAKETGMIKRVRKINPVAIFWTLIFGFGVELKRSLASLKRKYENKNKITLSDSSWYERFSPELVLFLKRCVILGIEQFARKEHRKLSKKLKRFKDVLIQDSTIIRVHEKLSRIWPAVRARKIAAGVKVSMLVSAVANSPKSVLLRGERTSEIKTMKIGPWVKDRILLIDLGFYKHHLFARIDDYKGFFVSKLKGAANPTIVSVNSICRGNSIDIVGKRWKEVLPSIKRQILDAEVEISFRRRKYKGKQRNDTARFRLIAIYHNEASKYHVYLTNIPKEILEPEEIASLYGARWEIELIFKELKGKYSLDVINTSNPHTVAALIWVAILTLIVSRVIYHCYREWGNLRGKQIVRFTQQRWSIIFSENGRDFLRDVLDHLNIELSLMEKCEIHMSQVFDPHVNRKRFREEWWA